MVFDPAQLVNLIISAIIGVLTSWLISHFYWRKNEPSERILRELKKVLPYYFHPIRYPQFYGAGAAKVLPEQQPPSNGDIPRIEYAVFSHPLVNSGDKVDVLLKIRDLGRNFENPSGIVARDHLGRELAPQFCGLGFASIEFSADDLAGGTLAKLTISLRDSVNNENIQSIPFHINMR